MTNKRNNVNNSLHLIINDAANDIADSCVNIGIDYNKLIKMLHVAPVNQKFYSTCPAIDPKNKGKFRAYFDIERTRAGTEYWQITLFTFANGEHSEFINTFDRAISMEKGVEHKISEEEAGRLLAERELRAKLAIEAQKERDAQEVIDRNKKKEALERAVNLFLNPDMPHESFYFDRKGIIHSDLNYSTAMVWNSDRKQKEPAHMIPMYQNNSAGDSVISGIQAIYKNGGKKFLWGSSPHLSFYDIGSNPEIVGEGVATMKTVSDAMQGRSVRSVFTLGNIAKIGKYTKSANGNQLSNIKIIAADNDEKTDEFGKRKRNNGVIGAFKSAQYNNLLVAIPSYSGDFNDMKSIHGCSNEDIESRFEKDNLVEVKQWAFQSLPYIGEMPHKDDALKKIKTKRIREHVRIAAYQLASDATMWSGDEIFKSIKESLGYSYFGMSADCNRAIPERIKNLTSTMKIDRKSLDESGFEYEIVKSLDDIKVANGECKVLITPMGSGKTQKVMIPCTKDFESFTMISPLTSLVSELSRRSNSMHYQQMTSHQAEFERGLSTTINSLIREDIQKFVNRGGVLMIDEVTQNLSSISSGTVKGEDKVSTMQCIVGAMSRSEAVIMADANVTFEHLKIINDMCSKSGKVMKVIFMDYDNSKYNVDIVGAGYSIKKLNELIANNKRVAIASDSVNQVKVFEKICSDAGVKCISVHQENKGDEENIKLMQNAEKYLSDNDIQVLIYSPTIKSGLSIEEYRFDEMIGYYTGTILLTDFQQMMHRARMVRKFSVELAVMNGDRMNLTADEMRKNSEVALSVAGFDIGTPSYDLTKESRDVIFDVFSIDRSLKSNAGARLCAWLYTTGYSVNFNFSEDEKGKAEKKEVKAEVSEIEAIKTRESSLIDDKEAIRLEKKEKDSALTNEEYLKVNKYKYTRLFGEMDNTEEVKEIASRISMIKRGYEMKVNRFGFVVDDKVVDGVQDIKDSFTIPRMFMYKVIGQQFMSEIKKRESEGEVTLSPDMCDEIAETFNNEPMNSLIEHLGLKSPRLYKKRKANFVKSIAESLGGKVRTKKTRIDGSPCQAQIIDFSFASECWERINNKEVAEVKDDKPISNPVTKMSKVRAAVESAIKDSEIQLTFTAKGISKIVNYPIEKLAQLRDWLIPLNGIIYDSIEQEVSALRYGLAVVSIRNGSIEI